MASSGSVGQLGPAMEADEIFPVFKLDDTKTLRSIIVAWTLRFNDVLDADQIHTSLCRLLYIGDWRKFGGRLRTNAAGQLEIHVPREFTAARPPIGYAHRNVEVAINDDPLGSALPTDSPASTLHRGPHSFLAFAAFKDAPTKLEDYLQHDTPQLSLHITTFQDATLVGLTWPHTLMDVMGQRALVHAWSLVMNGREAEVPALLGAREDVVLQVAEGQRETREPFGLQTQRLGSFGMISFGMRFAWDMLRNPVVEEHAFCLRKSDVESLVRQANADLDTAVVKNGDNDAKHPFISEGDVLTAFFARSMAQSLPKPRPITVMHPLNLRFRIPSLIEASGVFASNMAIGASLFLPSTSATESLGSIALENRRSLAAQATEAQTLAYLHEILPTEDVSKPAKDPATLLCGPSDALLVPFTNWTRAEFTKTIDFRAAVVRPGEAAATRCNPPGSVIYHHATSMRPNPGARNVFVLLGTDHAGNRWVTASLLPATWARLEENLKHLRNSV